MCTALQEEFEDIRVRKSKTRQNNCQTKEHNRTNQNLQTITQKTKERATGTPLKPGVNSGAPEG
jgi:hypothetical protein